MMGLSAHLYAFDATKAPAILPILGLSQTNRRDDNHATPLGGCVEQGHYLIWHSNPHHVLIDDAAVDSASAHADITTLSVNETVMVSAVTGHSGGAHRWSVVHDCQKAAGDISAWGNPPNDWLALRDARAEEQASGDQAVDYMFDVPADLFELLTGLRHDAVIAAPFHELNSHRIRRKKRPFWRFWQ
jgi:hypothetical protein